MNTILSLFFYVFMLLAVFLNNTVIRAQNPVDSLRYYYDLSTNPNDYSDYTRAYAFYARHMEACLEKNDTTSAINDLRFMASIQYNLGLIYDSEQNVVKALKLHKKQSPIGVNNTATGLYNQLGMIHRAFYNYEKSIASYNKALAASTNTQDSIKVLNNKAVIYVDQKNYKLALAEFSNAYKGWMKLDNQIETARALDNMGYVKSLLDDPEGISDMQAALEMRLNIDDLKGVYSSYNHLSEYFHNNENDRSALEFAEKAYEIAKNLNSISFVEDALSTLMVLKNDSTVLEYKKITDSITKNNRLQENKFAEMQYNYSEYERDAQQSKIKASQQRSQTLMYQAIGFSTAILAICVIVVLRSKYKKEKLQEVYQTESRISKKVHDEVANDIFKLMSQLQNRTNDTSEIVDNLESIYIKTRDISRENNDILTQGNFEELLKDLIYSYKSSETNVMTRNLSETNWNQISDIKKSTLYRVLQELMTNMKKHSKATVVVLNFHQKGKTITINYSDNGIGTVIKKNNGMQNMENRMASIKGIITFEADKGFKAKIVV